jgi:methionyl-tRNA formyltransferase
MKIVFFGSSKYSLIGAKIINETLGISFMVTVPQSSLVEFAKEKNIQVLETNKLTDEIIEKISGLKPDFLIVEDYRLILPDKLLTLPKFMALNIHHSLLPKFRGPSPAPSAILAGEKISGVTIIKMTNKVDAGDIYGQTEYKLKIDETTDSLLTKLNELGGQLIISVIPQISANKFVPIHQDETKVSYTKFMQRNDGFIDTSSVNAEEFDRKIRAYFLWPGVWTKIKVNEMQEKIIKFLPQKKLQVEGKKPMSYKDFINGYPAADPKFLEFLKSNV